MTRAQFPPNQFSVIFLAVFFVIILPWVEAIAQAHTSKLSPAEKWVIQQVKAGEIADLGAKFLDEKDRKLGAKFLEDLLSGELRGVKPHRRGVRIHGAIIQDPIDLKNARIAFEVELAKCRFVGTATFAGATFAGTISFDATTFAADANFYTTKVEGEASFLEASFEEQVNFGGADFASNFIAAHAQFKNKDAQPNFNSMHVGGDAFFHGTIFEGSLNFYKVDIVGRFTARKAHFKNKEWEVRFHGMKVGDNVVFEGAAFEGPVDLSQVHITGDFDAAGAKFKNKEAANFNSMKVGHSAHFENAVFEGPVDFGSAEIRQDFRADSAQFKNKEQITDFNGMKVGGDAIFQDVVFEGPVDFVQTRVAGNFHARKARFDNKDQLTTFNNMNVGHNAFLHEAVFEGPVNFGKVEIAGGFEATKACFNYQPVNSAKIDASGAQMQEGGVNKEDGEVSFNAIKVRGATFFDNAEFKTSVNFRYGDFDLLDVSNVSWPLKAGSFDMTGMTYKHIRATRSNEPQSHDMILKLVEQSVFSADVYRNLEAFFLRQGYRAKADEAFIAGKQRERREHLSSLGWLGSWLLDWLVGYGKHPSRAGYFCAFFVAFGAVLFSPKKMELQQVQTTPRIFNRFWYSLGLFLPVVNLESDKVWKPRADQIFLRNYMRVHILLGWILIPILLAALTGLIK